MTVSVMHNATTINDYVVSYTREKVLCTGVGTLHIQLAITYPTAIGLYDTFTVYEDDVKKGTYYVHTVNKDVPGGLIGASCQDGSIFLESYFIAQSYHIDYESDSADWIRQFLSEATVSYVFDGSTTGTLLNNDTTLGMMSALDQLTSLLQQNGWYFSFDADNVCHIGRVDVNLETPNVTVTGTDIINIHTTNHDKMFRNRTVVWGSGDPNTQSWVYADLNQAGNYANEYDANDVRSIVVANSNIRSASSANLMANRLIREFDRTNYEIEVELAGAFNSGIGSVLGIACEYLNTTGIVTTISVSVSSAGIVTMLKLNERCPRLFSFYDYVGTGEDRYVYVGTLGAGVWRKSLQTHVWENFSSGLTDLNIKDLIINNNTFACVTDDGKLFTRYLGESTWGRLAPPFQDPVTSGWLPASSGICTSCAIDKTTGNVLATFVPAGEGNTGWIVDAASRSNYTTTIFRDEAQLATYRPVAIDNNGTENVVIVEEASGGEPNVNNYWLTATQDSQSLYAPIQAGYTVKEYNFPRASVIEHTYVATSEYFYIISYPTTQSVRVRKVNVDSGAEEANVLVSLVSYGFFISASSTRVFLDEDNTLYLAQDHYQVYQFKVYRINLDTSDLTLLGSSAYSADEYHFGYGYTQTNGLNIVFHNWIYNNDTNLEGVRAWVFDTTTGQGAWCTAQYPQSSYIINSTTHNLSYVTPGRCFVHPNDHYVMPASTQENYCMSIFTAEYDGTTETYTNFVMMIVNTNTNTITLNESYLPGLIGQNKEEMVNALSTTHIRTAAFHDGKGYFYLFHSDPVNTFDVNYVVLELSNPTGWRHADVFHEDNVQDFWEISLHGKTKAYWNLSTTSVFRLYDTSTEDWLNNGYNYSQLAYRPSYTFDDTELVLSYRRRLSDNEIDLIVFDTQAETTTVLETYTTSGALNTNVHHIIPVRDYFGFVYYDNGHVDSHLKLVVPNTRSVSTGGGGSGGYSAFKGYDSYTRLNSVSSDHVEISQSQPVMLHGLLSYSGIVVSGNPTWTNVGELLVNHVPSGTWSSVVLGANASFISDVRSFNWIYDNNGDPEFRTYVVYPEITNPIISATDTNLMILDATNNLPPVWYPSSASGIMASGTFILQTFSGYANHIETTNNQDYPYIFVSVSGTTPQFWQKDSYEWGEAETEFYDYSTGLPSANITCIRCDDSL